MKPYVSKIWGWSDQSQKQAFEQTLAKVETRILVYNNKRVGYVQYNLGQDHTYIKMLILASGYQGKTFGNQVLDSLNDLQPELPTLLRCFKINHRAFEFYKRHHFKIIEQDEHFYLLKK